MDGSAPREIAISSVEDGGGSTPQRYLDIFGWNGNRWHRLFDATRFRPPGADDAVLPFGNSGEVGGRSVDFLRGVDFYGDGTQELVAGIGTYGATSGPLQTFIFSKVGDRIRTEFTDQTERGGTLSVKGRNLILKSGEYLPRDAMCCPSFMKTTVVGTAGGEFRYLDTRSEPTEYYVPPLEEASLTLTRLGPLEIGQTEKQAEKATGKQFSVGYDNGSCAEGSPVNGPRGISVMFLDGRVARIEVDGGNTTTLSGVGIGDSEEDVFAAYPGRIRSEPHPYESPSGWHYLVYTPKDAADSGYSLIFETDGQHVLSFRAGLQEAVSAIEGCF
jgi:hypothetical protein